MAKWLVILVLPMALGACSVGTVSPLPMALGPADSADNGCLTFGNAPSLDGCKGQRPVSIPQATR